MNRVWQKLIVLKIRFTIRTWTLSTAANYLIAYTFRVWLYCIALYWLYCMYLFVIQPLAATQNKSLSYLILFPSILPFLILAYEQWGVFYGPHTKLKSCFHDTVTVDRLNVWLCCNRLGSGCYLQARERRDDNGDGAWKHAFTRQLCSYAQLVAPQPGEKVWAQPVPLLSVRLRWCLRALFALDCAPHFTDTNALDAWNTTYRG